MRGKPTTIHKFFLPTHGWKGGQHRLGLNSQRLTCKRSTGLYAFCLGGIGTVTSLWDVGLKGPLWRSVLRLCSCLELVFCKQLSHHVFMLVEFGTIVRYCEWRGMPILPGSVLYDKESCLKVSCSEFGLKACGYVGAYTEHVRCDLNLENNFFSTSWNNCSDSYPVTSISPF